MDFLKHNARDKNGIFYSYYQKDKNSWGPTALRQTSQDLAYALCGFTRYYSITKDSGILDIIIKNANFIEKHYYDKAGNGVKWVAEMPQKTDMIQLVATLDQLYAYLIPLAQCKSHPYSNKALVLLSHYCDVLINRFYWSGFNLFYGGYDTLNGRGIAGEHTDFGHSAKAFWMIYEAGKLLDRKAYTEFALDNIGQLLPKAFDRGSASWGRNFLPDGTLDKDKEWWSFCILNQVAAIFSPYFPEFHSLLSTSLDYWLNHMVDHKHGGIWHLVRAETNHPDKTYPKQHIWKNAFHEFEHIYILNAFLR